jgi:hypothetical protein
MFDYLSVVSVALVGVSSSYMTTLNHTTLFLDFMFNTMFLAGSSYILTMYFIHLLKFLTRKNNQVTEEKPFSLQDRMKYYERNSETKNIRDYNTYAVKIKLNHAFKDNILHISDNLTTTASYLFTRYNPRFVYVHINEIFLFFSNEYEYSTCLYGGDVQKIVSNVISEATRYYSKLGGHHKHTFTGCVITIDDEEYEYLNYLVWRQKLNFNNFISYYYSNDEMNKQQNKEVNLDTKVKKVGEKNNILTNFYLYGTVIKMKEVYREKEIKEEAKENKEENNTVNIVYRYEPHTEHIKFRCDEKQFEYLMSDYVVKE